MKKQLIAIGVSLLVTFGAGAQWTGQSSSSDLVSPISRTGSVMTTNMFINDGVNGAQIRLNSSGTYYGKIGNPTPQVWSLGWGGSALDINPVLNWTAGGNIGVGTTTPSFKLDVGGNIVNTNTTNGWIGLTGDLPGYSNGVYGTLKTNATYIYFSGAGKYSGYLGGADAIFGLNNAASDLKVQLNTNGNSYFTGGNVGIGTMTPADQLEVVNGTRKVGLNTAISGITNGGVLSLSRADDGMKVMYLGTSAGPTDDPVLYGGGGGSEVRFVSGGLAGSGFGFYSNISSTNAFASTRPTPIVKIDGGGNVGIGNSSPDAKLAVSGQVH